MIKRPHKKTPRAAYASSDKNVSARQNTNRSAKGNALNRAQVARRNQNTDMRAGRNAGQPRHPVHAPRPAQGQSSTSPLHPAEHAGTRFPQKQNRQQTSEFFNTQHKDAHQEGTLIRKRKRRHTKRKKRLKIALIVVGVLLILGVGTAWGITNMIQAGRAALHNTQQTENIETNENAVTYDEGKTVKYNGHTYKLNDNMVSICVLGYDRMEPTEEGSVGRANFIIVMAFDTETGKTAVICLPRDSMVDVGKFAGDTFVGLDKLQLCLAFSYGNGKETSAQYTADAASRTLYNMPISYYYSLDMSGIGPMSDAVGGISLTPLQSIPNTTITKDEPIMLFGDNALEYVKWRDTSILTSALDRQARDIQFLKAFANQALDAGKGNIGTMIGLYNTVSDYSITNLGPNEFSYLASTFLSTKPTNLDVQVLTGEMKQGEEYAEYYLDKDSVYQTVLNVYYNQID